MTGVRLTKHGVLVATILFFFFISWYTVFSIYVLRHVVGSSAETFYLMAYASFNLIIAITLLLSSFFISRFSKIRIIYECSLATLIVTILLLFTSSMILRLMIFFAAGVFFSIDVLASFTYFWSLTVSEERGRVAGLIGFLALPIFHIVGWMAEAFDFFGAVMLVVILSLAPLLIRLLKPEKKAMLIAKKD